MMPIRGVATCVLLLLLASCASLPNKTAKQGDAQSSVATSDSLKASIAKPLYYAPGVRLQLPKKQYFPKQTTRAQQQLQFQFDQQSGSFNGVVTYGPNTIEIVMLNSLGIRGLTVAWDGTTYKETRHPQVPNTIQGRYILADILTIFGDDAIWNSMLSCGGQAPCAKRLWDEANRKVTVTDAKGIIVRSFSYQGGRNNLWQGRIRYTNTVAGYRLTIQSQKL